MKNQFLPYARQSINEEDIQEVTKVLSSAIITRGDQVEAFEKAIATYCGATYAVAFTSGSTALMAAYHVTEISPYDRIISTPNTFIATIGSGTLKQAKPVFVDIDRSSGNFQLEQVQDALEYRSTRGRNFIVPVHFSGIAVDMKALNQLIKNPSTIVIEDAAHAIGSYYPDGKIKVGSCAYSDMTIFSFHPAKTMTTGEGGIVTTNNPELYRRLRLYRNSGIERDPHYLIETPAPWYYEVQTISGNYNFTDFQAALGLSQLKRIDKFVSKRRRLIKRYRQQLEGISSVQMFDSKYDPYTAYHLCVLQIDMKAHHLNRSMLVEKLKEKGIGTQYHYIPLYRFPCYSKTIGDLAEYFPEMEAYYTNALSFPLYYELTEQNVDYICQNLKTILNENTISKSC